MATIVRNAFALFWPASVDVLCVELHVVLGHPLRALGAHHRAPAAPRTEQIRKENAALNFSREGAHASLCAAQGARVVLGGAVVVGEVERGEPRLGEGDHVLLRLIVMRLEAMRARDLPHAVDDAADPARVAARARTFVARGQRQQ